MKHVLADDATRASARRPPLVAYSEFMPAPLLGHKPYGADDPDLLPADNPHGWNVTEYEEAQELQPGLAHLAAELLVSLEHLGNGRPAHGIAHAMLRDNPFWPDELAAQAGHLAHERYVVLAPLALSRTQDDKGRVRWTLFGGSEQGPERPFWQSFFTAPGREADPETGLAFFRRLLSVAYGRPEAELHDLHRAGFRILPGMNGAALPAHWQQGKLPSWAQRFVLTDEHDLEDMRYLLTFRPFAVLSPPIRAAYLSGGLQLLPFPGSLLFWGVKPFLALQQELPFAMQIPLQHLFPRHENPSGLRVPQSGYLHKPHPDHPLPAPGSLPLRNTVRRTHRWQRLARDSDEVEDSALGDPVATALFSTAPVHMGLYDKPMARNAQLWTHDFRLLLDGPQADAAAIRQAQAHIARGGLFGYRFLYPAMRVGNHEVYWQRPLAACLPGNGGPPSILHDAPLGWLTAYDVSHPDLEHPLELWPQLLNRPAHVAALQGFSATANHHAHHVTLQNARKMLDAAALWQPRPLPTGFARAMLAMPRHETVEDWLRHVEDSANRAETGMLLARTLRGQLAPETGQTPGRPLESITYRRTATQAFETRYWQTIAGLADGRFRHKDNADCPADGVSEAAYPAHCKRDLDALGDYLLAYYRRLVIRTGMSHRVAVGCLPFHWRTDFDFSWQGGWRRNQNGELEERDLVVVIPGRDRTRAVIMADHYDTAYMEDKFEAERGGNGTRLASAGADDNHSATAALMLGAREFLRLSREGRLACDIWLVHLTGEEFPSDCMGARHLVQAILGHALRIRRHDRTEQDLSQVRIEGVYVLDMVAHNRDTSDPDGRDVFQISPGAGRDALQLAYQAHAATTIWNASAPAWNLRTARRQGQRSLRTADPLGATVPATALHPVLHGEVRTVDDPRSSLYNTDGQIFSDAGIPVVLFMENYDINRHGYHDTEDNMTNIDLDYGAAVAAIAIETVARVASKT